MLKPEPYAYNLHERQVVCRPLGIASGDPAPLLEPVDRALDPVPPPVHLRVKAGWATAPRTLPAPRFPLVFTLGDHMSDPPLAEPSPATRVAVAFVQAQ